MKTKIMLAFLVITLAACAPAQTSTTDIQNTAIAIVQTGVALTQTAMPTAALPPTFTPTALPTSTPPATPTSTQPIVPVLTPDPIQVERWKEYEKALAQSIFPTFPFEPILCEWDILARSGQEVYVWAVCAFSKGNDWRPAVIHLGADGSVHSVEIPKRGSPSDINRMFPEEAQGKFSFYSGDSLFNGRLKELLNHLYYRLTYPEEPPLIVLSVIPTSTPPATPTPTQPIVPIITPDAIQVERWKEYQAELAKVVLSFDPDHPEGYDPEAYKDALCEWDILGQSGQELYVWAMCASTDGLNRPMNPAVIYLKPDGSIREVNIVRAGMDRRNQLAVYDLHLFPLNVQEKLCLYYFQGIVPQCGSLIPDYVPLDYGQTRESALLPHLYYRIDHLEYGKGHLEYKEGHPEEPPLIILSAMPTATPIP